MKNRILFLLHLPPPIHGSSLVGLSILESKIINETFDCQYINLLASQNIAESGKITLRKMAGFFFLGFKVLHSIIYKRPKFCYLALTTTEAAFYRDVLLIALLKIFRIKLLYHLHNKGVSRYQHTHTHRFFYRFVFKRADVILLSKHLHSDIAEFVPEEKIHICPNGIADSQPEIRNPKSETCSVKILFLSNLIESKGLYILLEALILLKRKAIPFECNFIGGEGDVSAAQFNEKVDRLGLNSCVNYLGKKYGHDKELAFFEADIFIHPTYSDCFPLVIIEAMQYSLPIVSTLEGGIPDLVEDEVTGFLVQPKDVQSLAEKLEILIMDQTLRVRMGAAGRKKYEKEFTSDSFENRLVEILNTVISNK